MQQEETIVEEDKESDEEDEELPLPPTTEGDDCMGDEEDCNLNGEFLEQEDASNPDNDDEDNEASVQDINESKGSFYGMQNRLSSCTDGAEGGESLRASNRYMTGGDYNHTLDGYKSQKTY